MGLYQESYIYDGRLLRAETLRTLREGCTVPEAYLTEITKDHVILHAPGRCITLCKTFLEPHEIDRGYVDKQEVLDKIFAIQKYRERWTSAEECQLAELHRLVQSVDGKAQPGLYIAETEWCTLEHGLPVELKYNIRCV